MHCGLGCKARSTDQQERRYRRALELQINPFLRSREPAVIAAARAQGAASADPVDVLAALREWKNRFR